MIICIIGATYRYEGDRELERSHAINSDQARAKGSSTCPPPKSARALRRT